MAVLDIPLIIAFAGDSIAGTIIDFSATFIFLSDPNGDHYSSMRLLRLIKILWIIMAIVGICAGIRKYQLMNQQIAAAPPSTPGGITVVGAPVSSATDPTAMQRA